MNIAAGGGVPLSKSGIYPDILETFTGWGVDRLRRGNPGEGLGPQGRRGAIDRKSVV